MRTYATPPPGDGDAAGAAAPCAHDAKTTHAATASNDRIYFSSAVTSAVMSVPP
jgi:hypothetical protein